MRGWCGRELNLRSLTVPISSRIEDTFCMSTLAQSEREAFERLLGMSEGVVLSFSNSRFKLFMKNTADVDIYDEKYKLHGDSKANRLRAFWDLENDQSVSKVLHELLEVWQLENEITPDSQKFYDKAFSAIKRLDPNFTKKVEDRAIPEIEITPSDLDRLPLPIQFLPVIAQRFTEVSRCLEAKSYTAAVILSGSILEAVLLGAAMQNPKEFNNTLSTPTDKTGKPKKFPEWSLNDLINSAYDASFIRLDVKKYAHTLRDFRNFIHPFLQVNTGFESDEHTAHISAAVLNAALADLSGKRPKQAATTN